MKVGYIRYKNIDERYGACINQLPLPEKTKTVLGEFVAERRANSYRDVNSIGLAGTICKSLHKMNRELKDLTKEDVQAFFKESQLSQTRELWYKKAVIRFFKWLSKHEDDPKYLLLISWIDTKQLSHKCSLKSMKKREDNLISPEECRKMIASAYHLRDKLALSLLADTGIRAESVGAGRNNRSINIGQIEFYQGYAIIKNIEEKFDKRRDVIVTEALSYLIKYWNEYPEDMKKNPESPLFLSYARNRLLTRWGYSGLKDMIHDVSLKAVGRIINPHDFRHMRATRLEADDRLSDDSKCKLMGWSSRRMLERYSHTTFNQAKDEYLSKKGIIKVDEDKKRVEGSILKPKECLVCHYLNSVTDSQCEKCGNSLEYDKMIQNFSNNNEAERELQAKTLEITKKLSRINPETIVKFFETLEKIEGQNK